MVREGDHMQHCASGRLVVSLLQHSSTTAMKYIGNNRISVSCMNAQWLTYICWSVCVHLFVLSPKNNFKQIWDSFERPS